MIRITEQEGCLPCASFFVDWYGGVSVPPYQFPTMCDRVP